MFDSAVFAASLIQAGALLEVGGLFLAIRANGLARNLLILKGSVNGYAAIGPSDPLDAISIRTGRNVFDAVPTTGNQAAFLGSFFVLCLVCQKHWHDQLPAATIGAVGIWIELPVGLIVFSLGHEL